MKSKLIMLVIFYSLLLYLPARAKPIQGKILDSQTNEPIPYVSISNVTTGKFTSTNALGEFLLNDTTFKQLLVLRHISYMTDTVVIFNHLETQTIHMHPALITLPEVEISSDDYAKMLVEEAFDRLIKYSDTSYYGSAFYRMFSELNSFGPECLEAVFDVKTNNYRVLNAELHQGRYALRHKSFRLPDFSRGTMNLAFLGGHETKANNFNVNSNAKVKLLGYKSLGLNLNIAELKIKFKGSRNEILIFIDVNNFNIQKVVQTGYDHHFGFPFWVRLKEAKHTTSISFRPSKDSLMVVEYIDDDLQIDGNVIFKAKKLHMNSHTFFYDLTNNSKNIQYTYDRNKSDQEMIDNKKYDPAFWDNNPIVKRTAEEEAIIATFKKEKYFGKMVEK